MGTLVLAVALLATSLLCFLALLGSVYAKLRCVLKQSEGEESCWHLPVVLVAPWGGVWWPWGWGLLQEGRGAAGVGEGRVTL